MYILIDKADIEQPFFHYCRRNGCLLFLRTSCALRMKGWCFIISILENPLPKPLIVYEKNDVVISERSTVKFAAVPIEAITSVKDKCFFDHSGVDIRGITRSLWRNTKASGIV